MGHVGFASKLMFWIDFWGRMVILGSRGSFRGPGGLEVGYGLMTVSVSPCQQHTLLDLDRPAGGHLYSGVAVDQGGISLCGPVFGVLVAHQIP